jgi:hypothetical protein
VGRDVAGGRRAQKGHVPCAHPPCLKDKASLEDYAAHYPLIKNDVLSLSQNIWHPDLMPHAYEVGSRRARAPRARLVSAVGVDHLTRRLVGVSVRVVALLEHERAALRVALAARVARHHLTDAHLALDAALVEEGAAVHARPDLAALGGDPRLARESPHVLAPRLLRQSRSVKSSGVMPLASVSHSNLDGGARRVRPARLGGERRYLSHYFFKVVFRGPLTLVPPPPAGAAAVDSDSAAGGSGAGGLRLLPARSRAVRRSPRAVTACMA